MGMKEIRVVKEVRVVITCKEGHVAEALREVAAMIDEGEREWYEAEHGCGFTEKVEEGLW